MIKDDDAERAVSYLRDSAEEAGQAKANACYLETWMKIVKSQQMAKSAKKTQSEKEVDALCSPEFIEATKAHAAAVEQDNTFRFKREAAIARLDMYRTQQANIRGMTR